MPQPGRRRRFSAEQKRKLVEEAEQPGNSISHIARRYGISPALMFKWKRLMDQGTLASLGAEEPTVPESEAKHLKARIRELERQLGRKTMEAEILKEAIEVARGKKLLWRPSLPSKAGGR
jgi:transposase